MFILNSCSSQCCLFLTTREIFLKNTNQIMPLACLKLLNSFLLQLDLKPSGSVSRPAYIAINDLTPQHSFTHSLHIGTLLIFVVH